METYCSEDTKLLAQALLRVQQEMLPAAKDSTNPFCKSKYASLNSVMKSCLSALINNGVWMTQLPIPAPADHIALQTKLTHVESGQWQASVIIAPLPKNDPQGMGSALTYCRRYALCSMLGMVTADDDGESARPKPQNQSNLPQIEGVRFEIVTDTDGRQRLLALGNTMPKKDLLRSIGFTWHAEKKVWWRYYNAA